MNPYQSCKRSFSEFQIKEDECQNNLQWRGPHDADVRNGVHVPLRVHRDVVCDLTGGVLRTCLARKPERLLEDGRDQRVADIDSKHHQLKANYNFWFREIFKIVNIIGWMF